MNSKQRQQLDHQLTTPPSDCDDDGHSWKRLGQDEDGCTYYKCRRCGRESGDE